MKPWLLRLHRWSGLLIAPFVLVVGLTGAVTTYQEEIDGWLNADLLQVEPRPGSRVLPLDAVVAAAESAWPGLRATSVRLPQAADQSVEVSVAPPGTQDFSGQYVYVNGASGEVLGSRPFDPDPWSRRGVVASLYEVHYSLAASRVGVWLVSIVAAVWLLATLLGLVLAWPGSASDFARVWRVRTAAAAVVGWQAARDAARDRVPAAQPYSIYKDSGRNVYVARLREPGSIHRRGHARVYVDANDGRILAVWNPREGSAGDRLWAWQNPLHSGYAFGVIGRVLVLLSGIAAVLFVITGVPLWLARRPARKR